MTHKKQIQQTTKECTAPIEKHYCRLCTAETGAFPEGAVGTVCVFMQSGSSFEAEVSFHDSFVKQQSQTICMNEVHSPGFTMAE